MTAIRRYGGTAARDAVGARVLFSPGVGGVTAVRRYGGTGVAVQGVTPGEG